jgi:hypothetical protein
MSPTTRLRQRLSEAQAHRCCYCGIALVGAGNERNAATLEHVIPVCIGGWTGYSNIVVACRLCNFGRGTMLAASYFALVQKLGREGAYEKGRRWQRRHMIRKPGGQRDTAREQHEAATLFAGLSKEYRRHRSMKAATAVTVQ